MKKVLCIDSNHSILHETLEAAGFPCDLYWNKPVSELLELLPQYHGWVIRSKFKITAELLDNAPLLQCIGRAGAGMENIDVVYAQSKGIACLHAPEGNRDAVGEHALGMLLSLFNNINRADREVRQGLWIREGNRGIELGGKTVGIIGYGYMGSAFAQRLKGFNCRVLAYDKYKIGFSDEFAEEASLEQLFEEADVLSLHIPLTDETHYLVNATFLLNFKKPIYVINTARGKCLNTADLVKQMESGKVKGACLDVLEYEAVSFEAIGHQAIPAPLDYLIHSDRVVLTPHIAGWTQESNYKISKILAEKMIAVLQKNC